MLVIDPQVLARDYVMGTPLLADGRRAHPTSGFQTEDRPGHDGVDYTFPKLPTDRPVADINVEGNWWHPSGMSALASADGRVLTSNVTSTGGHIHILHKDGISTQYIHLLRRSVKAGDFVRKGQRIGEIGPGNTGFVHLHYQMRKNGVLIDPKPHVQLMPAIHDPAGTGSLLLVAKVALGGYIAYKLYQHYKEAA